MVMTSLIELLSRLWQFLREVSGENDYARCCAHASARGEVPPTREAFYLATLCEKYSRPNRCC